MSCSSDFPWISGKTFTPSLLMLQLNSALFINIQHKKTQSWISYCTETPILAWKGFWVNRDWSAGTEEEVWHLAAAEMQRGLEDSSWQMLEWDSTWGPRTSECEICRHFSMKMPSKCQQTTIRKCSISLFLWEETSPFWKSRKLSSSPHIHSNHRDKG